MMREATPIQQPDVLLSKQNYRIYPRIGRTFFPEKWDRN